MQQGMALLSVQAKHWLCLGSVASHARMVHKAWRLAFPHGVHNPGGIWTHPQWRLHRSSTAYCTVARALVTTRKQTSAVSASLCAHYWVPHSCCLHRLGHPGFELHICRCGGPQKLQVAPRQPTSHSPGCSSDPLRSLARRRWRSLHPCLTTTGRDKAAALAAPGLTRLPVLPVVMHSWASSQVGTRWIPRKLPVTTQQAAAPTPWASCAYCSACGIGEPGGCCSVVESAWSSSQLGEDRFRIAGQPRPKVLHQHVQDGLAAAGGP